MIEAEMETLLIEMALDRTGILCRLHPNSVFGAYSARITTYYEVVGCRASTSKNRRIRCKCTLPFLYIYHQFFNVNNSELLLWYSNFYKVADSRLNSVTIFIRHN